MVRLHHTCLLAKIQHWFTLMSFVRVSNFKRSMSGPFIEIKKMFKVQWRGMGC